MQDNLGSTIGTQEWGGMSYSASQGYYPFGAELRTRNALTTDYRFTGEQQDGTGLLYYGARYYDPQLGQFIAPDTLVPDATNVMDYQPYLGADYFKGEWQRFLDSPQGKEWADAPVATKSVEQDFGDYTSLNFTTYLLDSSLVIDDFGNIFVRLSPTIAPLGASITRGDVLVVKDPNANFLDVLLGKATATDIDQLSLSREEKGKLMQQLMVGESQGIAIGGRFLTGGVSQAKGVITFDSGITSKSFSLTVAFNSFTWELR